MTTPDLSCHRSWRLIALAAVTLQIASGADVAAQRRTVPARTPIAPLILGDLYARLAQRNQRLGAARSLARAAHARVAGTTRLPDPQFQIAFMNYTLPGIAPMPGVGMAQLQLMQMVPLGGKLTLAGRAARARAAATEARADDVSWDLRAQAAMAFYDLYAVDGGLDVARETLRLLEDIASTAASMYRVGEGRQADVLRAQVEITRMVEDTLRMHAMRQTMSARLAALLDDPGASRFGVPALPEFPDSIPKRDWLDSVAEADRSAIRGASDELRAARTSEQLARKEILPDVQIGVQYGQRNGAMKTDRMVSLMFGVSVPLYARDRQFSMRDEAAAMRQMAEADLAELRAETRGNVGEAYVALTRARSLAHLYRATILPQANATAESALAAYRAGSVDLMTLLDDRMAVNRYRQELYVLDADQGKAWAELEMLTGRELIDSAGSASRAAAVNAGGAR